MKPCRAFSVHFLAVLALFLVVSPGTALGQRVVPGVTQQATRPILWAWSGARDMPWVEAGLNMARTARPSGATSSGSELVHPQ